MVAAPRRRPNRLSLEKSPYLLKHASNAVDWYPWGKEALAKARNDGKPIFLSIGYSSCHWCHVMERESFEDEATAAIINKSFIPVKVDREERPDLDAYYMSAVQSMTGGGGWPLSVFLTPDLKPFYGGTYYPPEPRYGMPGFKQVLEFVSKVWRERREEAVGTAAQVTEALLKAQSPSGRREFSKELMEGGYVALLSTFDSEQGGFGRAPKFPLPLSLSLLLRHHYRTGKEMSLKAVTKTLDSMMSGGIRDHLGGGFHRYATDRVWLVPHFEKMLYDNALLAKVFVEAWQVTKNESYAQVARETLGWILREMRSEEGGFFSAQDADTEEGEGVFYTWTPDEVASVLGAGDGREFCETYGVTRTGNFEGERSILHLSSPDAGRRESTGEWREKLYRSRAKRPRPMTDTKVVTSWNGLAISALAYSGRALKDSEYVLAAQRAAEFVLANRAKDGRLYRRYAGGEAGVPGMLEDYAFLVQGLIDLFEASCDARWLEEALRLTDMMTNEFSEGEQGGFRMSSEDPPSGMVDGYDGPVPSGNSVAAMNLIRLAELTGEDRLRELARLVLMRFSAQLEDQPASHACMLEAADSLVGGMREVVISAKAAEAGSAMVDEVAMRYFPDAVLLVATSGNYAALEKVSRLIEGRKPGPKPVAYVCENLTCRVPAGSAAELRAQLDGGR